MSSTEVLRRTTTGPRPPVGAQPRFDIYAGIHKALRHFMSDTLLRLGRIDVDDADDSARTLDQVGQLLDELRHHVRNENDFVHTAIEARRPSGAARTAGDHVEHLAAIAELEDELQVLRTAPAPRRAALALQLYRHLSLFVAENLLHMHVEETANNTTLWALYDDAELVALNDRILASIDPAEMVLVVRWMARSLTPQELTAVCLDARGKLPGEVWDALSALILGELDESRRSRLAQALGMAAAPALVA